jgi:hypothetical protein
MDIVDDKSNRVLFKLSSAVGHNIPAYVAEAPRIDEKTAAEYADSDFADTARRKYPINTKAATWLSAGYLAIGGGDYSQEEHQYVRSQINKAAEIYGIADDIKALETSLEPKSVKSAESDDNWAWVIRDAETQEIKARRYPVFDAEHVKKASQYFTAYRDHYPLGIRREISTGIVKAAERLGVNTDTLDPAVLREAGLGIPVRQDIMEEALYRAKHAEDQELGSAMLALSTGIACARPEELLGLANKAAELFDSYDRTTGDHRAYGVKAIMPADLVFSLPETKLAEVVEDTVSIHNLYFSITKLAELPAETYSQVLGPDFVARVSGPQGLEPTKLGMALEALKPEDQHALVKHLTR